MTISTQETNLALAAPALSALAEYTGRVAITAAQPAMVPPLTGEYGKDRFESSKPKVKPINDLA